MAPNLRDLWQGPEPNGIHIGKVAIVIDAELFPRADIPHRFDPYDIVLVIHEILAIGRGGMIVQGQIAECNATPLSVFAPFKNIVVHEGEVQHPPLFWGHDENG
jgi:hypothetical protein